MGEQTWLLSVSYALYQQGTVLSKAISIPPLSIDGKRMMSHRCCHSLSTSLSLSVCLSLCHVKAESTYLVSMAALVRSHGRRQTGEGDRLWRAPCQRDGAVSGRLASARARLQRRVTETQTQTRQR